LSLRAAYSLLWMGIRGLDIAAGWNGGCVAALLIKCPVTGKEFSTGIETDRHSLELIPDTVAQSQCPHCGNDHAWSKFDARLSEDGAVR
jgi:hypothetical protein